MTIGTPLLAAVGTMMLAGFVQGLSGFGFGMIAMGMLPAVVGLEEAQALVTLLGLATFTTMTGLARRHVRWTGEVGLWVGSAAGIPIGLSALTVLPLQLVVRLLGLAICAMVLFPMVVGRQRPGHAPGWVGWVAGLASGILSGAFNIGGPPLVAYIYGRPWPKDEQVATLGALFLMGGLLRFALLLAGGRLPDSTWTLAAWAAGPMLVAIVGGHAMLQFVSRRQLRAGVDVALLALGGRYLLVGS